MAPSYLIIEVARLVDARSIALSIAEPPRWTPGTAVAVPLHEAERHRCIAMALWYTGAEVRARSDQGNAGYVPLGSHHRRIVISITVRQVKAASLRRQSLSMPAPNTPQQTLPWSAPTSVCSRQFKSCLSCTDLPGSGVAGYLPGFGMADRNIHPEAMRLDTLDCKTRPALDWYCSRRSRAGRSHKPTKTAWCLLASVGAAQ
jgi:hypothetical protein